MLPDGSREGPKFIFGTELIFRWDVRLNIEIQHTTTTMKRPMPRDSSAALKFAQRHNSLSVEQAPSVNMDLTPLTTRTHVTNATR